MRILPSPLTRRLVVLLLCSIAILSLVVGLQARQTNTALSLSSPPNAQVIQSASNTTSPFDYVVTVLMENNGYCDVMTTCGGGGTYQTTLAQQNGIAGNCQSNSACSTGGYTGTVHPSEGNYVALIGGDDHGFTSDCGYCPARTSALNLIDRIEASGRTWNAWFEGGSGGGTCSANPPRGGDHYAFITFTNIQTNPARCAHLVSTTPSTDTQFLAELNSANPSNYIWLTPTDSNNCHDTAMSFCDAYLAGLVPKILSSTLFTTKNAALFIVYDEGGGSYPSDFLYATWVGTNVKKAYVGTGSYSHYSYLKTLETVWNMPTLTANDAAASAMTEFFAPSGPVPLSTSLTVSANPIVNIPVTFTSTTLGGTVPYTVTWNFGDGTTGTGASVTHSYTTSQTFTVTATATDSSSPAQTATSSKSVAVAVPPPLTTSFTVLPANPVVNTQATFTASTRGGTGPYTVSWNFGDGSVGPGLTATHIFTSAQTFTAMETVTDSSTPTQTATSTKQVAVAPPPRLSASFTTDPPSPQTGTPVTFTATAAGGTSPYQYAWNFSDGPTGTGRTSTHVFVAQGTYTVTLNVSDSFNQSTTVSRTITVSVKPSVDFTITTAPDSLTIQQGDYGTSTVIVNSMNNFTGTLSFTASVDTGLNIAPAQGSTTVSPGNPANLTLTIGVLTDTNAGYYNATVTGSVASLLHSTTLTVRVTLKHQPILFVPPAISTSPGSTVKFTVNATDSDSSLTLALSVNNLPVGAAFDTKTGLFTWTPSTSQSGAYSVTFTATDNGTPSLSSTQKVVITVAQPPQPPPSSQPPQTPQPTSQSPQGTCLLCPLANIATGWLMFTSLIGGIATAFVIITLNTGTSLAISSRVESQRQSRSNVKPGGPASSPNLPPFPARVSRETGP